MITKKEGLEFLLNKYDVPHSVKANMLPGWKFYKTDLQENDIPLMPWRHERKFIELHKLVSSGTIEGVCMLRFCCLMDSTANLAMLMYREFDLCEFIGQGSIKYVHAVFTDNRSGNVIVKLDNDVIASVEIGNEMPENSKKIDRHEIIARRGVASDLVVDTQIPQESIYTFTKKGVNGYKDVDNELYGLSEDEVGEVRACFDYQKNPCQKGDLVKRHLHLSKLIDLAFKSNDNRINIKVEE